MLKTLTAVWLCFTSTQKAFAAPTGAIADLTVDLGYGSYRGVHNDTTNLNVWKGYVNVLNDWNMIVSATT